MRSSHGFCAYIIDIVKYFFRDACQFTLAARPGAHPVQDCRADV